jgi:ABC-type multidrug transport system ATPase subunit
MRKCANAQMRMAIMGANGSGKSTLLRVIFGYLAACEGEGMRSCHIRKHRRHAAGPTAVIPGADQRLAAGVREHLHRRGGLYADQGISWGCGEGA